MPPSRRAGASHSSKAASSHRNESGATTSSTRLKAEANTRRAMLEEGEEQQAEEVNSSLNRVYDLLEQFDQQPEPLTHDGSDGRLKTLRSDWASMEGNFEIAYQLTAQVAERLAEARSMEGLIEEDEKLQELDLGMRGMIDLQESVRHRRQALEELRAMVADGGQVLNAAETYRSKTIDLETNYQQKTVRQRYAHSQVYHDYRAAVWGALRDDDMPPIADLLPHDANEAAGGDDDEDDEVVAYGLDRKKFKCPLSLQIMTEPLKSTVCQHAFEKQSILGYLGNATKQCPTGCNARLNSKTLVSDPAFTRACRNYARREQLRREKERTQGQATLLD